MRQKSSWECIEGEVYRMAGSIEDSRKYRGLPEERIISRWQVPTAHSQEGSKVHMYSNIFCKIYNVTTYIAWNHLVWPGQHSEWAPAAWWGRGPLPMASAA
jgi:hypothetical protein